MTCADDGILILLAAGRLRRRGRAGPRRQLRRASPAGATTTARGTASRATGISADERCPGSDPMGNAVGGGARVPLGATGTTTFTAPGRDDDRRLHAHPPARPTATARRPAAPAGSTRSTSSAARCSPARAATRTRRATASTTVGSWYGYPEANVVVPRSTVSRSSFPALAGYRGTPRRCRSRSAASTARVNTACTVAARRRHLAPALRRPASCSTTRPRRPRRSRRRACWPAAAAPAPTRSRSTPSDNGGIRRVEIIDVTGGGGASSAPRTTRPARAPTRGATCSFRLAKACPNLRNETVRPTQPGRRPADAQGPHHRRRRQRARAGPVRGRRRHAVGPRAAQRQRRDRGRQADRPLHRRAPRRAAPSATARASRSSGRLLNSAGRPDLRRRCCACSPATAARARASSSAGRDHDRADGIYRVKVRAAASRLTQVAWRSHVSDPGPQESAYVTLQRARLGVAEGARRASVGVGGRCA